jgi:xylose dehydrogenase (NAD/NADP)
MHATPFEEYDGRDWFAPEADPLRFALVGLGGFTQDWILPAVEASDLARTTCLVSGSPGKADRVAAEYDVDHALTYEEFTAGTAADAYDAVYVCTPNATHLEYVRAAAAAGKHVLCEKPMEATLGRAEDLVAVCEDEGVTLMVAYRLQVNPVVRWLREVVRGGALGDPVHVRGTMGQDIFEMVSPDRDQWRLDDDLSGGAALIDLGIYPLNATRFLLDADPVAGGARTASENDAFADVDEHVGFVVEFDDGTLGSYTASQQSLTTSSLQITGTAGELTLEPAYFGHVEVTLRTETATTTLDAGEENEMRREFDYFGSCVHRGERPEPDGEHALADMRAITGLYDAADTGVWGGF